MIKMDELEIPSFFIIMLSIRMRNIKNLFSFFSTKTYAVGTQKNRLNERVLLRTLNIC